jgi:hypothetical protein
MNPPSPKHPADAAEPLTPGSKNLFRNDYYTIYVDEATRIISCIRSERPFASLEDVDATYDEVLKALSGIERSKYAFFVDMRAVVGRNDPTFEAALARHRGRWLSGYRRVGTLVQTAVGAMQIRRLTKQDGIERLVSADKNEVMRYLAPEDD